MLSKSMDQVTSWLGDWSAKSLAECRTTWRPVMPQARWMRKNLTASRGLPSRLSASTFSLVPFPLAIALVAMVYGLLFGSCQANVLATLVPCSGSVARRV